MKIIYSQSHCYFIFISSCEIAWVAKNPSQPT